MKPQVGHINYAKGVLIFIHTQVYYLAVGMCLTSDSSTSAPICLLHTDSVIQKEKVGRFRQMGTKLCSDSSVKFIVIK